MKKFVFSTVLIGLVLILSSCYTPSPLYGTWQSNDGTVSMSFLSDGTVTYVHPNFLTGESITDTGTWQTFDNVLFLSFEERGDLLVEWDIRGSILHMDTGDVDKNGNPIIYTLFRASK